MPSKAESSISNLNTLNAAPAMHGTLTVQSKYGQRIVMNIVTLGKF